MRHLLFTILLASITFIPAGYSATLNGFDLEGALVPAKEIHRGGPAKDGIPALTDPLFESAEESDYPADDQYVLGVHRNGVSKAYPIAILDYHEVVNDYFGDEPVAVTWCPLCGSGIAYKALFNGQRRVFGVSGLLYNSDVLLYDRETESLWSQLLSTAVAGPLRDSTLEMIPMSQTTWGDWRERYPDTLVLSTKTGHPRNYQRSPYKGYASSKRIVFPVAARDNRYHPKEQVLGIIIDGQAKAYPFSELATQGSLINDQLAGQKIQIQFDEAALSAQALDTRGQSLPATTLYWFAWIAFHPDSAVYSPSAGQKKRPKWGAE